VYACAGCGRHATTESASLVSGHRFPRDIILLAVRYYLQLGAAAERIAGVLADRGLDVSGRTILRWVQKFGPSPGTGCTAASRAAGHDMVGGRNVCEDSR
jgi:transposase-like protein